MSDLELNVNGRAVSVADDGASLLEVLRDRLGLRSVKDGCSPQGQCGCCTVLVDGQPRVSCVTPARRVEGRAVTTVEGLTEDDRRSWGEAFCAAGASQCGFCTPGIVLRLHALREKSPDADDASVANALLAHLCRCTGWRTIFDASRGDVVPMARDFARAEARAVMEGGSRQRVSPEVALGQGRFADDEAPFDALVAVPDARGGWAIGETLTEARARAGKVQGRRTTIASHPPLEVPDGDWDLTLRTSWVEPAYLELDASWCMPGGEPASPLANGGAFGGKVASPVMRAARDLADRHGRAVRVLLAREDVARSGPKRPPIAAGIRRDASGIIRVARTAGFAARVHEIAPAIDVVEVDVAGPPTSIAIRGAGWVEAAVLLAAVRGTARGLRLPQTGVADASIAADGSIRVTVSCGDPLDEITLRSYCVGAAHMAYSWVVSEQLAVADDGAVHDLTIRSFGVVRAVDMPPVEIDIRPSDAPPVNGSDAVFAAVAAATWLAGGLAPTWPTGLFPSRSRRAEPLG
ncbi:MAG: 2Fe-2S iron-sulfur cluster binding domain-containing protein [Actinobacteria bacterium]|nr:MAG: 2Fe-2S iron-sulfur cluster binding domain-containing protein [Actinomycetota bacterium]